jgi:homogentisate 1,2-dioxygenase
MYYTRQGILPIKPFTTLSAPNGERTHEEMVTSIGFSGPASLLYHLHPPTVVAEIEPLAEMPITELEDSSLWNHQVRADGLLLEGSFSTARVPLFFNEDLVYSMCSPSLVDEAFHRNGMSDELLLVVRGSGRIGSAFGTLEYEPLDFIYIPRGCTVRLEDIVGTQLMVLMETSSPVGPPQRYLNLRGQLSYRGMYQERDIRLPCFNGPYDVVGKHFVNVKVGSRLIRHTLGSHPFDLVGWDGTLYPYAISMSSFAPMSGRVHTLPDSYQVFESKGVAISAITPMRQPDHEDSTPAQPDHTSDCDEIFHRLGKPNGDGFEPGIVTLHTRAAAHGAALVLKERPRRDRSTGWGVLIDTVNPTKMARDAAHGDVQNYHGGKS